MDRKKLDQTFLSIRKKLKLSLGRIMSSPEDIDDVLQETYLRAIASRPPTSIRDPEAYLFRTSRNIALNEKAKIYRQLEIALPPEEYETMSSLMSHSSSIEKDVDLKQQFAEFCLAVSELPIQCRKVFLLRKVYGYSQNEVANKLGISISTVESHITKGMQRTRQSMSKHERLSSTQSGVSADG